MSGRPVLKQLLTTLQESRLHSDGLKMSRRLLVWLDQHQADVRELVELKGEAFVEETLALPKYMLGWWLHNRSFTESPQESRDREARARAEAEVALKRLLEATPELVAGPPGRWLDAHEADLKVVIESGMEVRQVAETLGVAEGSLRGWCISHQINYPGRRRRQAMEQPTTQGPGQQREDWRQLSPRELQKQVAADIKEIGQAAALERWEAWGMKHQHWAVVVRWARKRGYLPAEEAAGSQPKAAKPTRAPERSIEYLRGWRDGMERALELIFAGGAHLNPEPAKEALR